MPVNIFATWQALRYEAPSIRALMARAAICAARATYQSGQEEGRAKGCRPQERD